MYHAYDYDSQKWVAGEAARKLLVLQTAQTIAVLESPRGEAFASSYKGSPSRAALLFRYKRCLSDLEAGAV